MTVITRYPPSPTGETHIGNFRAGLFNYLFAKHAGGQMVMRFEDTDRERSKREYEQLALNQLEMLGMSYDLGPFRQSDRTDRYIAAIEMLIADGKAYEAEESQDGSGDKVIRFKNPNRTITFSDHIRGDISIDTTDFGDFVIARSKTNPLYHLTVVVDDIDMNISHVIRGEDHITSTPRQILLIEALGGTVPQYAHMPMIIGDDKKKLSKRHGAVTVRNFVEQGYLPAAITNYLALLGWNPGDDREIFSMDELIAEFSLERVNNSPATFNYDKLASINRHYILQMSDADFTAKVMEFLPEAMHGSFTGPIADKIMRLVIRERINKFSDVTDMAEAGEFDYFFTAPTIDWDLVTFKDQSIDETKASLAQTKAKLQDYDGDWDAASLKDYLWDWSGQIGRGQVLHPLRTTLSGRQQSPDPFTLMDILGRDETLNRISV